MKNKWISLAIIIVIAGLLVLVLRHHRLASKDQLNADGIRPDVAEKIAHAFPKSERKRGAATQLARAFQLSIMQPDRALEINALYERAKACLLAIEGKGPADGPSDISPLIEGWVVDSIARSRAYIHYNAGLSGQVFSGPDADISSCDFDPSNMRN